jgi:hypothetical protein
MEWNVWYRPEGAEGAGPTRDQDKGKLTIASGKAAFEGKKKQIAFDRIRSVGRQRISLWLMWADIEYEEDGQVHHAYFGDRRMLGWAGILGSNAKIAEAAEGVRAKQGG